MSSSIGLRDSAFTPQEQNDICRDCLPWAEAILRRRFGHQGVEYAGLGLVEALGSFDPDRGCSFREFAPTVLIRTAGRQIQRTLGTPGSARRQAQSSKVSVADFDEPCGAVGSDNLLRDAAPDLRAIHRDELVAVLAFVDRLENPIRLIGLGVILGGMSIAQISKVLHIDRNETTSHLHRLWQLLRPA